MCDYCGDHVSMRVALAVYGVDYVGGAVLTTYCVDNFCGAV